MSLCSQSGEDIVSAQHVDNHIAVVINAFSQWKIFEVQSANEARNPMPCLISKHQLPSGQPPSGIPTVYFKCILQGAIPDLVKHALFFITHVLYM